MRPFHVYIAEDIARLAAMLHDNLEMSPAFKVVGIAVNGQDLLDRLIVAPALPDIVLMDIQMPVLDGIAATAALKSRHPQVKIVMATVFDDEESIFNSILAGADGYLMKDEAPDVLHRSLLEVMDGGAPMSPAIARKALSLLRRTPVATAQKAGDNDLSERELEILEQLGKALRYEQIAANLHISTGTVRKHIEHIYRKLQVHNKTAAVDAAKRMGLID